MEVAVSTIAMLVLGFALLYMMVWIFIKPVRLFLKIAVNSTIGALCLILFNYISGIFGFSVGVNLYSAAVCGVLGIPGFLLLVLSKLFI